MSKENLEQFMNQIAESEELQAKIGEEIDAEALIALGAECGCEFTAEELQESAELSDDELDTVSGGRQVTGSGTMRITIVSGGRVKKSPSVKIDIGPVFSKRDRDFVDRLGADDDTQW